MSDQEKNYLIKFTKLLMQGDFQVKQLAPEHKECEIWIDRPKEFNHITIWLSNISGIYPHNPLMVIRHYIDYFNNFGFSLHNNRVYYNDARIEAIKSFTFHG